MYGFILDKFILSTRTVCDLKNVFISASNIYSSDEEGSDIETHRPKKNTKGKALKDSD